MPLCPESIARAQAQISGMKETTKHRSSTSVLPPPPPPPRQSAQDSLLSDDGDGNSPAGSFSPENSPTPKKFDSRTESGRPGATAGGRGRSRSRSAPPAWKGLHKGKGKGKGKSNWNDSPNRKGSWRGNSQPPPNRSDQRNQGNYPRRAHSSQPLRSRLCWYGKDCNRSNCPFQHDEDEQERGGRGSPRGRYPRAGSRQPSRGPLRSNFQKRVEDEDEEDRSRSRSRHAKKSRKEKKEKKDKKEKKKEKKEKKKEKKHRKKASPSPSQSARPSRSSSWEADGQGSGEEDKLEKKEGEAAEEEKEQTSPKAEGEAEAEAEAGRKESRKESKKESRKESRKEKKKEPQASRTDEDEDSDDEDDEEDTEGSKEMSFRDFLDQMPDDIDPAIAVSKFSQYQDAFRLEQERQAAERLERERLAAQKNVEVLRSTGLFFDLYHPLAAVRRFDLRAGLAVRAAQQFVEALAQGKFKNCHFRAPGESVFRASGDKCKISGHFCEPYFATNPDADCVTVHNLPPSVSVWNLIDHLTDFGFSAWACTAPDRKLARDVRVRFSSGAQARSAIQGFQRFPETLAKLRTALVSTSGGEEFSAVLVPPIASRPSEIEQDLVMSASIIRGFGERLGLTPELIAPVLEVEGSPEEKLDLQLLYLRLVHNFCYYSAEWCDDVWALHARCGAAALRTAKVEEAFAAAGGAWRLRQQSKIQALMAAFAAFKMVQKEDTKSDGPGSTSPPPPPSEVGADPEMESVEALSPPALAFAERLIRPEVPRSDEGRSAEKITEKVAELTEQLGEEKSKCKKCSKLFKGNDFVAKHIRKTHADVLDAAHQEALFELASKSYLEDPERVVPPKNFGVP